MEQCYLLFLILNNNINFPIPKHYASKNQKNTDTNRQNKQYTYKTGKNWPTGRLQNDK